MKQVFPEVTLTLDDSPTSIRADSWRVSIRPTENNLVADIPVNLDAKLRWSELDRLTGLRQIHFTGQDAGVEAYVASRPAIYELSWHKHGKSLINLQSSALTRITIECGESDLTLKLPNSGLNKQLILHASGDLGNLHVDAPNRGEGSDLTIWYLDKPGSPKMVKGLERIESLSIWYAKKVDITAFTGCTEIERLDIRDVHTSIENIATISKFTKLQSLKLKDCYNFGEDEFPLASDLPRLESIGFDGLRSDDAQKISNRFKGFKGLSIRGKRTEAWLLKNRGNPFMGWSSDYGKEMGAKACRIYNTALTAIDKLGSAATVEQIQAILKKFIDSFNRMDLDTIMREEVAAAFEALAQRTPKKVSKQQAFAWFEDWRDF